ncbi:MAG: class I SAM-dependent methyltransferase, partial [Flammeovirgaceae bacterium]|nr:class I SAM-dependent methyltransferase [Flammeovirgaceae bacterium]MDW8287639.1 class I SAM-dependent methyltransferase [Flammeovirgaceae bacterium]
MQATKHQLLSTIFRHLDGLVVAPSAFSLYRKGVLSYLLANQRVEVGELSKHFNANEGYLNVALRTLASQGWLLQEVDNRANKVFYACNANSERAFSLVPYYEEVVRLMQLSEKYHPRKFEEEPFQAMLQVIEKYKRGYDWSSPKDEIQQQILSHIEGVIVGPSVVHLGMGGMFHKYFMEASFRPEEFHAQPESFKKLLDFFTWLGWFNEKNGTYQFTEKGFFFARRASAYGVTVSYIPTLRKLDELIFGNPTILWNVPVGSPEQHVDREMNVWGSGGAHATYFKVIDEIIIELFNRPIGEQPKGILDMGCGNGAFLQHLYEVIEKYTQRGKVLDEYPLFLIGVDYNEAALKVTRANLVKAGIWAKVIWGDIGKPDLLAQTLKNDYGILLEDLLNVRTFLDHNRIWEEPLHPNPTRVSTSTGAFAYRGRRLSNNLVEDSLFEHLKKWEKFVRKFG